MGKRITIGLLFNYDENWIGGSYYILNLIQSLKLLENDKKPNLVIFSNNPNDFEQIKFIEYPFIKFEIIPEKNSVVTRIINKIFRFFFKKNLIKNTKTKIDFLFPSNGQGAFNWVKYQISWIPDFQELYYPEFYPNINLEERKNNRKIFSKSKKNVIFSSKDALGDYNKFFPENNTKNFVLNFSVFHPEFSELNTSLLLKYRLNDLKYFICPNQFWKHKNQIILLKALIEIRNKNKLNFITVFTGKEHDYRNKNYFDELIQFVKHNKLEDYVKFLGFIDRKDQLFLIKNAIAVIQPSLFEGWSTVVEDSKRLNQNCIVSNLKVHLEQLEDKGFYFNPNNEIELAKIMINFLENNIPKPSFNYDSNCIMFGNDFLSIVNKIIND